MSEDLIAAIGRVSRDLPMGQVLALAASLEDFDSPSAGARSKATAAVPTGRFADQAVKLVNSWAEAPDAMTGHALAVALRASALAIEQERTEESIEIVWTGPRTAAIPVRLTREALLDVIRAATTELIVVSFAAYKIEAVVAALSAAVEAGVTVRLILEGAHDRGGTLTFEAASTFDSLRNKALFYAWPLDKRPVLGQGRAALHAKAAIADDHVALVTSANLTGHAIAENMELGLLVRGGVVPRHLAAHFRELIVRGDLVEVL